MMIQEPEKLGTCPGAQLYLTKVIQTVTLNIVQFYFNQNHTDTQLALQIPNQLSLYVPLDCALQYRIGNHRGRGHPQLASPQEYSRRLHHRKPHTKGL